VDPEVYTCMVVTQKAQELLGCLTVLEVMFRWTLTFPFMDDCDPKALEQVRKSSAGRLGQC
jgi:hypothetical protein